jgi:hypothetical protein
LPCDPPCRICDISRRVGADSCAGHGSDRRTSIR